MVVVPVFINQKGPYNFILDTGVGIMIITDPTLIDSIQIKSKRLFKFYGEGNQPPIEAYITGPVQVTLPGISSNGVSAAILKTDQFSLSGYAGMPIHGLLGYEFFNQLAVKFNFVDSSLTAAIPGKLRITKKAIKLPISVEDRKPYLKTQVALPDGNILESKFIVDIGAGHPVSLESVQPRQHCSRQNMITANLGVGFTGPVSGCISRINGVVLGKYELKNVVTSFPDSIPYTKLSVPRDGNLGLGILKRFLLIIDYQNQAMYLKPNCRFKEPFEHDMSGLEYYAAGNDYKRIIISRVEPGSAGAAIGMAENDEITGINFKPVAKMSMVEIDDLFKSKNDRNVVVEFYRDKKREVKILTLKRRI